MDKERWSAMGDVGKWELVKNNRMELICQKEEGQTIEM